jgi:RNA polymerase sigma-70 factor (ECF subfamily)
MLNGNLMIDVNTEQIRRAQTGDAQVLSALYERYYRGIRQIAEDLTSEVFLRMLRFIAGFHPPASMFQSWLFQIARNLAIDHYRKMSRREHLPLEERMAAANVDLDRTVEHNLTSESLLQALDRLTEDQRDVILMRFIAEMPLAQVARALHKSEDAVKGLQRRALLALRRILTEWEISYG